MKKIKKQVKNRKLEQIIKHFYPDIEKTAEIEDLFSKKIKRFFVAISKSRTFAVYSKDSGFWKKIFGDEGIKITKYSAGTKMAYKKHQILKIQPGEAYNLFILK